jgi:hypothetical protein
MLQLLVLPDQSVAGVTMTRYVIGEGVQQVRHSFTRGSGFEIDSMLCLGC